jgi:F-type H+-transporting ATPase subunit a
MLGKNLPLWNAMGAEPPIHQGFWDSFIDPNLIHIDTLLLSAVCMTLIVGLGGIVASGMTAQGPGGKGQAVVEGFYTFCDDLAHQNIGHHYKTFFPLIAAIFTFVLMGNIIGVFPWQFFHQMVGDVAWPHILVNGEKEAWEWASPTTDFNVTVGLATVAVITYIWSGFWKHGGHFVKIFLFSPMSWVEWLDLIIRPSTLALRLMVVITADELMRGAFLMLAPMLVPVGIMAFEIFIGGIQALVFSLLTSVYIGLTVAENH